MERLAHSIRTRTLRTPPVQESDLVAMAHDPVIQRELAQSNAEFAPTEADGLELIRCAYRDGFDPDGIGWTMGFRVVVRPLL